MVYLWAAFGQFRQLADMFDVPQQALGAVPKIIV
jgi:hypothetical protein